MRQWPSCRWGQYSKDGRKKLEGNWGNDSSLLWVCHYALGSCESFHVTEHFSILFNWLLFEVWLPKMTWQSHPFLPSTKNISSTPSHFAKDKEGVVLLRSFNKISRNARFEPVPPGDLLFLPPATQASPPLFLAFSVAPTLDLAHGDLIRRSKMTWVEDVLRNSWEGLLSVSSALCSKRKPTPFLSAFLRFYHFCTQTEHHSFRLKDASRTCDLSLSPWFASSIRDL